MYICIKSTSIKPLVTRIQILDKLLTSILFIIYFDNNFNKNYLIIVHLYTLYTLPLIMMNLKLIEINILLSITILF